MTKLTTISAIRKMAAAETMVAAVVLSRKDCTSGSGSL